MASFAGYEQCPRCAANGRDRRGDNFGIYTDGSKHCFSCGYHVSARRAVPTKEQGIRQNASVVLPSDFTREVPSIGWKWILQYGLSYSYWKTYCGYSPKEDRLVITHGNPTYTSVGRYLGDSKEFRKWRQWGNKSSTAYILESTKRCTDEVILVEDIISAHKVRQVADCVPLFGTNIYPKVLHLLMALKRPVALWLDEDQYTLLPQKINRLQTFLGASVRHIRTTKDPKEYDTREINRIIQ
jgi:hypothetical protein